MLKEASKVIRCKKHCRWIKSILPSQYTPQNIRKIQLEKNKGYIITLKKKVFMIIITNTLLTSFSDANVLEFCRLRLHDGEISCAGLSSAESKSNSTHPSLDVIALTYNTAGSFSSPRRDRFWVISYCHRPHTKWNGFMSEGNYRKF